MQLTDLIRREVAAHIAKNGAAKNGLGDLRLDAATWNHWRDGKSRPSGMTLDRVVERLGLQITIEKPETAES